MKKNNGSAKLGQKRAEKKLKRREAKASRVIKMTAKRAQEIQQLKALDAMLKEAIAKRRAREANGEVFEKSLERELVEAALSPVTDVAVK